MLLRSDEPSTATLHMGRILIGTVTSLGEEVLARKPNGYVSHVTAGYFVISFDDGAKMDRLAWARWRYSDFRLMVRGDKFTFRGKVIGLNQKQRSAKMAVKPGSIVITPSYD